MTHLEVSVNDPLLVAVLDCRHYLDRRDARLRGVSDLGRERLLQPCLTPHLYLLSEAWIAQNDGVVYSDMALCRPQEDF